MARSAVDARVDVTAVVEEGVIGETVNAHTFDGLVLLVAVTDELQLRTVALDGDVTVHAGLRRGHRRMRRGFDAGVAVHAGNAEIADVQAVVERHRLLGPVPDVHHVRMAQEIERRRAHGRQCEDADDRALEFLVLCSSKHGDRCSLSFVDYTSDARAAWRRWAIQIRSVKPPSTRNGMAIMK